MIAAALILAAALGAAALLQPRFVGWRRNRGRQLVRVHLVEDSFSLEGVLVETTRRHYVLASASHIESAERTHALDGLVWLPRERVLYLQVTG